MKTFFPVAYFAIILGGCIMENPPSMSRDNDDSQSFGNETYVWDDWNISDENDDFHHLFYDMLYPAIP